MMPKELKDINLETTRFTLFPRLWFPLPLVNVTIIGSEPSELLTS